MQYGVVLAGYGEMADPEKLRRAARRADELGFHSLWLYDHVSFPAIIPEVYGKIAFTPETPFLDPMATLAFLAAETRQIRLGLGVLLVGLRHPLQVAKSVATLDVISGGRAAFGVGLGWVAEEFEAMGIPFRARVGRMRESVEILRMLWAGGRCSYQGRHFSFPEMTSFPVPVQAGGPPILVGAFAEPALRRAAEIGDGWLGAGGPVEKVLRRLEKVRGFADAADKRNFELSVSTESGVSREVAARFRDVGATQLCLNFTTGETAEIERQLEEAAGRLF